MQVPRPLIIGYKAFLEENCGLDVSLPAGAKLDKHWKSQEIKHPWTAVRFESEVPIPVVVQVKWHQGNSSTMQKTFETSQCDVYQDLQGNWWLLLDSIVESIKSESFSRCSANVDVESAESVELPIDG